MSAPAQRSSSTRAARPSATSVRICTEPSCSDWTERQISSTSSSVLGESGRGVAREAVAIRLPHVHRVHLRTAQGRLSAGPAERGSGLGGAIDSNDDPPDSRNRHAGTPSYPFRRLTPQSAVPQAVSQGFRLSYKARS